MSLTLLAVDPGLAACGIVGLHVGATAVVEAATVVRTAPSPRRQRVHVADDTTRRIRELAAALEAWIRRWRPGVVVVEAFSPPRHASSAAKLAAAYSTVATLAEVHGLPLVAVTPQETRRVLLGRPGSKDDLAPIVHARLPALAGALHGVTASLHNHAEDAAAVALAALDAHEVLRLLRARVA